MTRLGNFRDVFKTIKHKKPTAIFCPRCGSPEIKLSSSLDYWLTPRKYVCPKCGYEGILVMELEPDESSQDTKENVTENTPQEEEQNESKEVTEEKQDKSEAET